MGPSENPELTEINTEPPRLRTRQPPGQYITKRIYGTTVTLAVVPEHRFIVFSGDLEDPIFI